MESQNERKKDSAETILVGILAINFPKPERHEFSDSRSFINSKQYKYKKSVPRHILVKLLKINAKKKKSLSFQKKKKDIPFKGGAIKFIDDISKEIMEAIKNFVVLKETTSLKFYIQWNYSSNINVKYRHFWQNKNLTAFIILKKKKHLKLVKLIVCNLHIDKANLKRKINIKRSCLSRNKMIPEENMEIWEEVNTRKNKHV